MHIPVLLNEVIEGLSPLPGHKVIDCTVNEGGHSREIIKRIYPNGKLLGIDLDDHAIESLRNALSEEFDGMAVFAKGNFADIESIAKKNDFNSADSILFDLGMSNWDIEESGRGFSFRRDEPLDMRYDRADNELTAASIVNSYPLNELVRIFNDYGQEGKSYYIAKAIIAERKKGRILTTFQLNKLIERAVKFGGKIHPSTKIFQALRIETNNELENIKNGLKGAYNILKNEGRIAVISFHSLEDAIVKNIFRDKSKYRLVNKKPIKPSTDEIFNNKKSRSAKLRIAIKI